MTTIAYDGRAVASDTQITTSGRRVYHSKTHKSPDGTFMVAAGNVADFQKFIRWHEAGAEPGKFPKLSSLEALVVLPDGRVLTWGDDQSELDTTGKPCALGSGGDYALGAMHMGASAAEAVRVAAVYDIYTSGEVEVFDTNTIQPVRRRSTKKR